MATFTVLVLLVFCTDFAVADTANINEQEVSLSQDIAMLREAVLTLQDTVRCQGVLITDLNQRNQQQEKRIEELEAAQKNRDEHRAQQENSDKHRAQQENSDKHRAQQENSDKHRAQQDNRDKHRAQQDNRDKHRAQLGYLESKFTMASSENKSKDHTMHNAIVQSKGIKSKEINRKERLLASLIPPTNTPPFEEGIVAFYAQMPHAESNPGAHHTLIFDKVRTNVGNGYNGVTGIFTAPREGIYVFNWVIRILNAEHSTELLINNDIFGATFLRAKNGDDGSVSGTAIAHVGKGDAVFVRTHSTYAGDGNVHSNQHGQPTFSGWLLH